ncbi:MAG: ribonuclease III [Oscillospiraceae bacterium]|jgi:ribonuclease-3 family protein|nr:ribonuclease III [Oscillospiraceae bacterium]
MKIITKEKARNYSPLTLAFFGDSVYEVLVRGRIILNGSMPSRKLHSDAAEKARAAYQANAAGLIKPLLTEEEADILRRGRNANPRVPKSAEPEDYRRATGLEALFGYLALIGEFERAEELFGVICGE